MKNISVITLLFVTLLCSSCGNKDIIDTPDTVTKEAILVESFEELGKSDDVDIRKTSLEGNVLTMVVSYSGGCKEHEFTLAGLNAIQKSSPPSRSVILHHNGNSDICREMVTETLTFNITKLGFSVGEEITLKIIGSDSKISYTL